MSTNNRALVKQIRQIVKGEYDYWFTYNDPVADGRKIKFMHNGYQHSDKEHKQMKSAIVRKLKAANIDVQSAGWESCESYHGSYNAFIVRICT